MSASPTPAWGTPVTGLPVPPTGMSTDTDNAAETQVMPPMTIPPVVPRSAASAGPRTVDAMQLRVTALHYANRILGDQPTANPDTALSTTLRVAKGLEAYLLTGQA